MDMDESNDGAENKNAGENTADGMAPVSAVSSNEVELNEVIEVASIDIIEAKRTEMAAALASGDKDDIIISTLARPRASSASKLKRKVSSLPTSNSNDHTMKKARIETEPVTVSPKDRAIQFASEGLIVSNGINTLPLINLFYNLSALVSFRCPFLHFLSQGTFLEVIHNQRSYWPARGEETCEAPAHEVACGKGEEEAKRHGRIRRGTIPLRHSVFYLLLKLCF